MRVEAGGRDEPVAPHRRQRFDLEDLVFALDYRCPASDLRRHRLPRTQRHRTRLQRFQARRTLAIRDEENVIVSRGGLGLAAVLPLGSPV
jgi:hypothetical protein